MINLRPSNIKLRDRMIRIATDITGCDAATAESLLERGNWNLRSAIALYEEKR
jgi:N-acetylmuramic acid 6-phosphate (MurNAc-6-P) etherase